MAVYTPPYINRLPDFWANNVCTQGLSVTNTVLAAEITSIQGGDPTDAAALKRYRGVIAIGLGFGCNAANAVNMRANIHASNP